MNNKAMFIYGLFIDKCKSDKHIEMEVIAPIQERIYANSLLRTQNLDISEAILMRYGFIPHLVPGLIFSGCQWVMSKFCYMPG
ncbi:MAG: hypothetical protein HY965_04540 [Ignavibacteriales bacterium]|nr:hypothetical protein [Ignavibacteriales bacterium]